MNETKHPKPKFELGDLVMLKSYASAEKEATNDSDQPKLIYHSSPVMVVTGIEIEDKKKKTHDNELGKQIGERIKYHVIWFDNKKSDFVAKVLYESLLSQESRKGVRFEYEFGKNCNFATAEQERKRKVIDSHSSDEEVDGSGQSPRKQRRMTSFISPPLVSTGIRKNEKTTIYHDQGGLKAQWSEILVKVLWFNSQQQKYSEKDLPIECIIN